jgi:phosphoesterase RecJ-like protein
MNNLNKIAQAIQTGSEFIILTHASPDGDTLGCAFALCHALQALGKKFFVEVIGELPDKYKFMAQGLIMSQQLQQPVVISVDVASPQLLEKNRELYENKIDLCIDHHEVNSINAKIKYCDATAAAAAEIVLQLIKLLNVPINGEMADCIYTGISTDTGCFKFPNTTAQTHRAAAEMIELSPNWKCINKLMFDTKTRNQLAFENRVMNSLEYFADGKGAFVGYNQALKTEYGVKDEETDAIANLPCRIEGVLLGLTLKEKTPGEVKVSVRSNGNVNSGEFCKQFGGGGHSGAAGAKLNGSLEDVKALLVAAGEEFLNGK